MKKEKTTEVTTEEAEVSLEQTNAELKLQNEALVAENEALIAENEELKKSLEKLQVLADKSDSYLNQLVAIKNDFESYKRRMKFNAEQARQDGVQSVALKLIAIADTFEMAEKHLTDEETLKAFKMVQQQLLQVLTDVGIEMMEVVGKEFDHMTMNALSQMDYGPENSGKVVEVYKNGYTMDGKVLRYAEVIVGA